MVNKYNDNNNPFDHDIKISVKNKKWWIIDFPYKIIYNYIKQQANFIWKTIKEIISDSHIKTDTVILIGKYSSNDILTSLIKKELIAFYIYIFIWKKIRILKKMIFFIF